MEEYFPGLASMTPLQQIIALSLPPAFIIAAFIIAGILLWDRFFAKPSDEITRVGPPR